MSSVTLDTRVEVADGVRVREVAGEAIVLDLPSSQFYSFDGTAARMWRALVDQEAVGEAHAQLLQEYEVSPERLAADLIEFVEELVGLGLLILRAES